MRSDRASAIRRHLHEHGPSAIADLAAAVGASLPTLRRDLAALEAQGLVQRDHGGARLAEAVQGEVAFERRAQDRIAEKRAIAAAAHGGLRPGATVFLDAGTTVLQLARRIRAEPLALTVFTNCLPVAQILGDAPGVKVTLLGGTLRPGHAAVTGPLAEAMLDGLWIGQLFLGAGAVDGDLALWSADESEARLNARMIARAESVTLLAGSEKFGQRSTYRVGALAPFARVVSDDALPASTAAAIRAAGPSLILATPHRSSP